MDELAHGEIVRTDARTYRLTITLVALDAAQFENFDPTTLVEVSRIGAEVLSFETQELFLIDPVCSDCISDNDISNRDHLLQALDKLVTAELGDEWTLNGHMAIKRRMLETIDDPWEAQNG